MIVGSKHVGAILCFNVKFYVSALVGVMIKVILRNARCNNKDTIQLFRTHLRFLLFLLSYLGNMHKLLCMLYIIE